MKQLPPRYYEMDGCHSCEFVFIKYEYDDPPEYFCHHDNSKRPDCGSVLMEENFFREGALPFEISAPAWNLWSSQHSCMAWGFCSQWKQEIHNGNDRGLPDSEV